MELMDGSGRPSPPCEETVPILALLFYNAISDHKSICLPVLGHRHASGAPCSHIMHFMSQ